MVFVLASLIGTVIGVVFIALYGKYVFCRSFDALHTEWRVTYQRLEMEKDKNKQLQEKLEAQNKAVEASALPWFAKNDKLEARFEADALDKLDNPEVDYQDVVSGLGGTS